MKEHHAEALEDLASQIDCPKGFFCIESGFEVFGKAEDRGLDDNLICLDDSAPDCKFAVPFCGVYFCCCPV